MYERNVSKVEEIWLGMATGPEHSEYPTPRGYLEIAASILGVCLNGSLRTHVMFRSNLNSKQLKFYLESLTRKNLIEEVTVGPGVIYRTTEGGRRFYETYNALAEMLQEGPSEAVSVTRA